MYFDTFILPKFSFGNSSDLLFHFMYFIQTESYIQILWNLEVAETHVGRAHSAAWDKCSADLAVSFTIYYKFR